ncbi:hypothetical protein GE21DRAFT_1636 [Neurospora crassa]|uniref:Uncharacterized protein n=1 Tax=Neurospora crassa (strain ATCC 24698 / 74-OR23-1A / CBS 708.71 / DSM 1257 / FGSC 987) TaxID=367110 RepID=V5IRN6_NEUCR|nr:hypothetical protein NCU16409 [Neurospora crassa OR74A]ESA44191.1 hypothetical protein NCU16409 [Neurospora crassa OR74A]KHE79750.1 hypothetical protein GE21DRAFT_1636 [Neurospora crassa]|eukprot:XP_011393396.1 hypothetical protein NCU16409 [Neurospora crassa OR74A]
MEPCGLRAAATADGVGFWTVTRLLRAIPPTCPLCPRLQDLLGCIIFVRSAWERMRSNAVRINSLQISSLLVQRAWCVAGGVLAATAAECVSRRLDLFALWWIAIHEVETAHLLQKPYTSVQKGCLTCASGLAVQQVITVTCAVPQNPFIVESVLHNAAAALAALGSYAGLGENNKWDGSPDGRRR